MQEIDKVKQSYKKQLSSISQPSPKTSPTTRCTLAAGPQTACRRCWRQPTSPVARRGRWAAQFAADHLVRGGWTMAGLSLWQSGQ